MAETQILVRVDDDLIAALDGAVASFAEQNPGLRFTRSDAVRMALHRWIQDTQEEGSNGTK